MSCTQFQSTMAEDDGWEAATPRFASPDKRSSHVARSNILGPCAVCFTVIDGRVAPLTIPTSSALRATRRGLTTVAVVDCIVRFANAGKYVRDHSRLIPILTDVCARRSMNKANVGSDFSIALTNGLLNRIYRTWAHCGAELSQLALGEHLRTCKTCIESRIATERDIERESMSSLISSMYNQLKASGAVPTAIQAQYDATNIAVTSAAVAHQQRETSRQARLDAAVTGQMSWSAVDDDAFDAEIEAEFEEPL